VFAYLALNHRRKICRDIVREKFWPNATPASARNCLNVTMHRIRRLLHSIDHTSEHILFHSECYFFNPAWRIWLDVDEFKAAWKEGQNCERKNQTAMALRAYERAAEIYTGDFMEQSPYEDWLISEREHLREVYLVILDKISNYYSQDGQPQLSIELCELMLEKDSCQEEVYRRLMKCYYRLGARDKALKSFLRCREVIKKELDVQPTDETVSLYEQIKKDRRS
jgi:DNA-binding SARP family transcriptional activator